MDELPSLTEGLAGSADIPADITLQALAELGVYKFNCRRAVVSAVDGVQSERIIADATHPKYRNDSGLSVGRGWRVSSLTTKLFTGRDRSSYIDSDVIEASGTRCVVRNLAGKHDGFGREWSLARWPEMQFYAAVPIRGQASGHVLGTYCIVDDGIRTRNDFDEDAVRQLQEVADAIAQHLQNALTVRRHHRSEKLTEGLATFIEERSSKTIQAQNAGRFDKSTIWDTNQCSPPDGTESNPLHRQEGPPMNFVDTTLASETSYSVAVDSPISEPSPVTVTSETTVLSDSTDTTTPSLSQTIESSSSVTIKIPDSQSPYGQGRGADGDLSPVVRESESEAVSRHISSIFSSASHLLRDSMNLDGVMFFGPSKIAPDGGM